MDLREFNTKASPGQKVVLRTQERFPVVVTGIQAGKTTVGAVWLCSKLYADYLAGIKGDYLIAAPTVKILQQSTLPKFREIIPMDWGTWKEGSKFFELKWGSRIFVRSTDDPDYLEGMTIRAAWLDEAGQMKQLVWTNIQGRLSIAQGPCLMTTTPYSMGWFFRDIIKKSGWLNGEKKEGGDLNIHLITWTSTDNPAFPKEEFERMRATLPRATFERRYLGKFTQLEGLVYPDFNERCIVEQFVIPAEWSRWAGEDFGHTNPTAIIALTVDPIDKIYYAYREFYKSESILAQSAAFISDNGFRVVYADPQSAQLIAELNRAFHLNVKAADNDLDMGIQRLTQLFREGRLKVFRNCQSLIDEIETYHYPTPDDEGAVKDKPVAKNNHAVDALRYGFSEAKGRTMPNVDPLDIGDRVKNRRFRPSITRSQWEAGRNSWTGY